MNLMVKLAIPVIGKVLLGNNWQAAINKVSELASDTTMSGKEKWAVVEQMLIDAGMQTASIFLLWTGWSRSDRYCRQLEAMLDEYRRADAAQMEGSVEAENSA